MWLMIVTVCVFVGENVEVGMARVTVFDMFSNADVAVKTLLKRIAELNVKCEVSEESTSSEHVTTSEPDMVGGENVDPFDAAVFCVVVVKFNVDVKVPTLLTGTSWVFV